jgi:hypothetical protein
MAGHLSNLHLVSFPAPYITQRQIAFLVLSHFWFMFVGPRQTPPDLFKRKEKFSEYVNSLGPVLRSPVLPAPEKIIEAPIRSLTFKVVGSIRLIPAVFDQPLRKDIVKRVVDWQRAKARQGSHKEKFRNEVSGGGRKPWPQKGTGRARASSIRSPLFRKGGRTFARRPSNYEYSLPKKVLISKNLIL